jgi:cytochrome c biogenesis protein CcmG/thiol:disulfide interchange protein DsbE
MSLRTLWPVVLALAALCGLLVYGVAAKGSDTSLDDAVLAGERVDAPVMELPRLGGEGTVSLADYEGQVVVLNFWGSWCPPCIEELPLLERTHRKLRTQRATVLGVDVQDVTEDALGFVRRFDLTFPNVRDRERDYVDEYGVAAYPETFVIDRQGRVAAIRRGPVDQEWLDATLPPLLAESA